MERTALITQKITLAPEALKMELKEAILNKLKELFLGACTRNYGHILEILEIVSYRAGVISPVSIMPTLEVDFRARILKPEAGSRVEGSVSTIQNKWILVTAMEKIQILISWAKLKDSGFVYNPVGVCYQKKEGGKTVSIRQGDLVSLEIFSVAVDLVCLGKDLRLIPDGPRKAEEPSTAKAKRPPKKKPKNNTGR